MIYKYAKVGGPPDNWSQMLITDLETGEQVDNVVEVNADEGWLIRQVVDEDGHPVLDGEGDDRHIRQERIEGLFEIVERKDA